MLDYVYRGASRVGMTTCGAWQDPRGHEEEKRKGVGRSPPIFDVLKLRNTIGIIDVSVERDEVYLCMCL